MAIRQADLKRKIESLAHADRRSPQDVEDIIIRWALSHITSVESFRECVTELVESEDQNSSANLVVLEPRGGAAD